MLAFTLRFTTGNTQKNLLIITIVPIPLPHLESSSTVMTSQLTFGSARYRSGKLHEPPLMVERSSLINKRTEGASESENLFSP